MKARLIPLALSLPTLAFAQTLDHVRVDHSAAPHLAAELEAAGWDVVEGGVTPSSLELVVADAELRELEARGLTPTLLAHGRPFAEIQAELYGDAVPAGYPDLAAIEARMAAVAATYPGICKLVDLTATYGTPPTAEGRHLWAVKVSDNVDQDEDEPTALVVAAHHCRELVTPLAALDVLDRLTRGYAVHPAIQAIVDQNEVWIAPVWNPDGYVYVFEFDNMWRKNRLPLGGGEFGVDLNRNYPFGWSSTCAGSTSTSSLTYKGPGPGSEAETQTMMAFSEDRRFAKVLDYHSSGQEVLWGYLCSSHPLETYLQSEAVALSTAMSYGGDEREPSAEGEHFHWQLATYGSHAFLAEIATSFQPSITAAEAELTAIWPGVQWLLELPIPLAGHVWDLCAGLGFEADVSLPNLTYLHGETRTSGGAFHRYHVFAPPGPTAVEYGALGFGSQSLGLTLQSGVAQTHDVALVSQTDLTLIGTGQIGTALILELDSPADRVAPYFAATSYSGTSPGFPFGACALPLNWDPLMAMSITGVPPFNGFVGLLDLKGKATASLDVPLKPNLVGLPLDFAYLTVSPLTGQLRHVSGAKHIVLAP